MNPAARWLIVILVWPMARDPARSAECPPRKCRMETPFAQPAWLAAMKSRQGAWHQVAIIVPSSCQQVAKRSQSPASRQTAQFSTRARIARRSRIS